MVKLTNRDVANMINSEGILHTINDYLIDKNIDDPVLAHQCMRAEDAINFILVYLADEINDIKTGN